MKRKLFIALLALEAALCVALCLMQASLAEAFSAAVAFPFEQAGLLLRALSLTGRLGNAAALALYAALCLLPIGFLIYARGKRKLRTEDALLALLSVLLFAALYLMINPGKIGAAFSMPGEAGIAMGKAVLGGTLYSVLAGYIVLRVLRRSFEGDTDRLHDYLRVLLALLNALFVWAIFYIGFADMLGAFTALASGNVGSEAGLGMSYAFIILKYLVDALPYALDILTVFLSLKLLEQMRIDRYAQATVDAARRLSRWCAAALAAVVLANVGFNILQLAFAGTLRNIDSTLNLPLTSILFVLAALFIARLAAENRALKQDSDLII